MDELSDTKIRNASPAEKEYALADGQGLSLVVRPNGTKLWLYRYRYAGRRKNMSFGTFPGVGLKAARDKRHDAEKLLDQGQDPVAVRDAKRREDGKLRHTFRAVGEEWVTTKLEKENKAEATIKRERWNLDRLYREIGDRPLCEIAPPELLTALRRVEARGRFYTVGRLRSTASRVFQFGVGAAYCDSDPTRDLKHALTRAPKGSPRPALTDPDDVGDLMRRIEVYDAKNGGLVRYALKLIALTMVRPGELRLAEWSEFDEANYIWLIPAAKMKMRDDHEVPLSRQALAVLAELRPLTGRGRYLFSHDDDVPMSDNTINKALRIMGYDTGPGGDHCAHGFRSSASTLLNEEGVFDGDVVEAQLAHETDEKKRRRRDEVVRRQLAKGDKNKIRGIYNRAAYWSERVRLMQHWADRLDRLRERATSPVQKSAQIIARDSTGGSEA
ncbi:MULTISPECIES: tyrosine-type recombinase/integrase [unclassified Bradyrhizobium]|uniref:tyrosine-type recombinase/integrase n=1 Tax=unclassified Bradyrhizobium TaxID=2631580 RepID=UPI0028EFEE1B|nr:MULTISPECIES: integrase arm-type DNA-binding domain-containing protein [unclassified Bradyrhizobium]